MQSMSQKERAELEKVFAVISYTNGGVMTALRKFFTKIFA